MKKALPEIVSIGAYDASLVLKITETPPRRVWLYEIEVILEDGGTTHVDHEHYPIRAGEVIIGKPGQIRHTTLPFKCLYLHLMTEDEELRALLDALPDVYLPASPRIGELFSQLIEAHTIPETDAGMRAAALLCGLLSELIRDARYVAGAANERRSHADTVARAIAFMDENLCQNITLEQIASYVYLNRFYFRKIFIAATGRTPYRYLLERRLAQAQKLLMTTDLSIGAIARECGFSSQSYFNQVFARELGCTPMGYKRQMSLRY